MKKRTGQPNRREENDHAFDEDQTSRHTNRAGNNDRDEQDGEQIHFDKIEDMARQVYAYIKEYTGQMDKKTLAKYVAVATLVVFGLRKNNFLGRLVVSAAAGMVAKYILEKVLDEQFNEEDTAGA